MGSSFSLFFMSQITFFKSERKWGGFVNLRLNVDTHWTRIKRVALWKGQKLGTGVLELAYEWGGGAEQKGWWGKEQEF